MSSIRNKTYIGLQDAQFVLIRNNEKPMLFHVAECEMLLKTMLLIVFLLIEIVHPDTLQKTALRLEWID